MTARSNAGLSLVAAINIWLFGVSVRQSGLKLNYVLLLVGT